MCEKCERLERELAVAEAHATIFKDHFDTVQSERDESDAVLASEYSERAVVPKAGKWKIIPNAVARHHAKMDGMRAANSIKPVQGD